MVRPLVEFAHWLSPYHRHARSNSLNTANSLSSGPLNFVLISTMTKKNSKKSRYFWFSPNLAHRKLIDLAKYVPSSSFRGVLSFTQRFFKRRRHSGFICRGFLFAKNESLYRRISTKYCKYKSSKLFWRILEDNKQNKHENGDIITVRIFACRSPIRLSLQHRLLKHNEFLPAWPSLSFLPSNPC